MMSPFSPTAILVGFLLLYVSSFLIFAIVRVATGISIQRIGYFSLRRIAYTPREGVQIELRGLGLSLHLPSFAQPTWISVKLTDLSIVLDLHALERSKARRNTREQRPLESQTSSGDASGPDGLEAPRVSSPKSQNETSAQLARIKATLKRIHRLINWLALVDVVAVNTSIRFLETGQIQIGSLSLAVDTRPKMAERGNVFRLKKDKSRKQRPVEWMINVQNVLLTTDGQEPTELIDTAALNVHGFLYKDLEGLRDASIVIKIGRIHIPYDNLMPLLRRAKQTTSSEKLAAAAKDTDGEFSVAEYVEKLDTPESQDDVIAEKVVAYKQFLGFLLRGIQEIQVTLSFFRLSRSLKSLAADQHAMYLNVVSHELGVDLHRMDQRSPSHRMYFRRDDIAHQALFAAIALSVSLDDSSGETDNILYIPMATTTIKTTLPSKTVSSFGDCNPEERNANVLFANLVITSPSLDLEPKHVSRLLAVAQSRAASPRPRRRNDHHLIYRLLPKATIKVSIHEPVIRFILPISNGIGASQDEYNLLIYSISSISLDSESSHESHEPEGDASYSLSSTFRAAAYNLYYQTPSGVKHNLLTTETLELKILLNAAPEVSVIAFGSLNSCSAHIIDSEVNRGIHQLIEQFRAHRQQKKTFSIPFEERRPTPLRRLPPWLLRFQFEATGLSLEIAGVDGGVSEISRGVSLQLESWTADYRAQKYEPNLSFTRRRTPSYSTIGDVSPFRIHPASPPRMAQNGATDGRRLAFHVRKLEGFVIESDDYLDPEPFLSLPRFEVALSTTSDRNGPLLYINSVVKGVYLQYSLYRYYCLGIAMIIFQDTFMSKHPAKVSPEPTDQANDKDPSSPASEPTPLPSQQKEPVTIDVRVTVVQLKTFMPSDPPMLLQIHGLTAGRHRLSSPFAKANLVRLHAEAPKLKGIWARIVSLTNVKLDQRMIKLKQGSDLVEERTVDIGADFIRLGVPHLMVMHRIFDNIINTTKALKQLNHRFKSRSSEFISQREPEKPKKLPRISLRCKALLFALEDDTFEWKLGCIYRTGLREQNQRLAREEAFYLKSQKVKESGEQRSSKLRAQSSHQNLGREFARPDLRRSTSADANPHANYHGRGRKYRYDTEGSACLSSASNVSTEVAWYQLQLYNARSWKHKIGAALRFQGTSMKEIRNLFSGVDEPPDDGNESETILAIPNRPALMSALISDVNLVIDKPFFPFQDYPTFLHEIGKGMPMSTQYALLIPMSIRLDMGEARVNLRDYPLDLLHVPALRPGQSPRLPSWSLRSNFVIAEEFRDYRSSRQVQLELVPSTELPGGSQSKPFFIDVWRSVSPVKTYSDPTVEINTSLPTSISWGMSYQPVIQDMMKIFEGFTKPEIDLSERVGFWDKIRLSFHSRIRVIWKEDGDVHLRLKGSRDPYVVTGFGAGFVMCWRKDVRWDIHTSDDPKRFMSVTSGEYVLAVPDYSHEARYAAESPLDEHGDSLASPSSEAKNAAIFKKVIMKLSGDVEWAAGLVFERNLDGDKRSFSFRPHYDVVLQNPKYVDEAQRQDYDAFRGFRSNHIHLSIAVVAPESRNWSVDSVQPSASYNTVHLSPRFFTHFFKWWSLFSGVMSLPVRQGPLWPGITKTSKKFARHLATVKYKLLFAPLFVAHIYKHKDREEYSEDVVTATGLKVRLDSLKLDVHQRREQIRTLAKGRLRQQKASAMRINQAQLDLMAADFRAVSASIGGTNVDDIEAKTDDVISSFQQPVASVDLSRFTIPDHNLDWIDMDDFVELDWILPQESNPRTQILPLAFTPRFTYFRQTDHGEASPDDTGFSKFGDEPTHMCVMSENNDERRVQMELIKERLAVLDAQILNFEQTISEKEHEIAKDVDNNDPDLRSKYDLCVRQAESLVKRRNFLMSGLRRLERHLARDERGRMPGKLGGNESETSSRIGIDSDSTSDAKGLDGLYASAHNESARDFNNRFIIHNIQFKWNNSLRNIVLRYIHQVSQRRGFVYYMSRRAVKFILDIVTEQNKNKRNQFYTDPLRQRSADRCPCPADADTDTISVEDRIEQLLNDANRFVNAEDNEVASKTESNAPSQSGNSSESIAPEFTPQNSYHLRLIAPQIQLQSEKNQKSVLLVAAKGMQLKVVSIMDKERMSDDVCGLVQRRFSLDMDGAQFFVATQKNLAAHLQFYAGNKYGNPPGSAWPPWITLEAMFDFELNPFGFSRIVPKTSASLRYDKYNKLRLKYNEEVAKGNSGQSYTSVEQEPRMDQIKVDFPHFRAICDSTEYYTMYIIVLDLLLFSEPLEKVRNERLEKIMLTSDFSDLRGAPEMVFKLQDRIRRLEEIKEYFQVHAKYLDKSGWEGCLELERDLTSCEDELFFLMKAITTSQRKIEPLSQTHGVMRWSIYASEVVWHLMKNESERLVEFQLRNAEFERTDNSDGSNLNSVTVERVYGFNLLPDAIYPQIIAPYLDQGRSMDCSDDCMVRVKWYMLEAVAGIPVLDDFEVKLFPLKIQLERELGQKLFEYIFPGVGSNAFENGGFSPMMIKNVKPLGDDDDSDDESDFVSTAHTTPISGRLSPSDDSKSSKGPGSIEQRLRPTFRLSDDKRPHYRLPHLKDLTIMPIRDSSSRWGLSDTSRHIGRPGSSGAISSLSKKRSFDSLRMLAKQNLSKPQLIHPATIGSPVGVGEDKSKKWNLPRGVHKQAKNKENRSHLSEMISRASNYMTLAHVRVNDVVLCVSYKGKGGRNLEDIHDFVFRLPVLEYRNKTWSNLDLALRLKKDVTKALISHAPAILGNKFSHHRPSKQQLKHQRELASSSLILRNPENTLPDQSLSLASFDSACEASDSESLMSYKSNASPLSRTNSADSTARSNLEANRQISSSHSLNEADLDSRQEPSHKETSLPVRPTTSGGSMKHFMSETNGDDNSLLSHKSAFRNLGRKLIHPRRGS